MYAAIAIIYLIAFLILVAWGIHAVITFDRYVNGSSPEEESFLSGKHKKS